MIIQAGESRLTSVRAYGERRFYNQCNRPVLKLLLSGGVTDQQIEDLLSGEMAFLDDEGTEIAVHSGYNTMVEHQLCLARVTPGEAEVLLAEQEASAARAETERVRISLSSQIEQLAERLDRWKNAQSWTELETGATIPEGTVARHLFKLYICVAAHTKRLLDTPLTSASWAQYDQ